NLYHRPSWLLRQKRDFKASKRNSRKPTVPSHKIYYVKWLSRMKVGRLLVFGWHKVVPGFCRILFLAPMGPADGRGGEAFAWPWLGILIARSPLTASVIGFASLSVRTSD
ncbi:hypothetical protein ACIP1U_30790, partial [Cupriavidus sp. NPDC089707]|uniref:hypothetical protein n=1 Tax=Cupriavidus sp. NPDC089707 TaxID=3363963 RepID=UPI0038291E8E